MDDKSADQAGNAPFGQYPAHLSFSKIFSSTVMASGAKGMAHRPVAVSMLAASSP